MSFDYVHSILFCLSPFGMTRLYSIVLLSKVVPAQSTGVTLHKVAVYKFSSCTTPNVPNCNIQCKS